MVSLGMNYKLTGKLDSKEDGFLMQHKDLTSAELAAFPDYDNHEVVRMIEDPDTGLRAFIAVHNTTLGPSLGGCRMNNSYATDRDAITDVLRLSRGMTYKNALAGLPLGGGKSVIIGNPYKDKTQDMMIAMAHGVDSLGGKYISAEDSGTTEEDIKLMARHTSFVAGFTEGEHDGVGGDPSPVTAYGVYCGMKATLKRLFGRDDLKGVKVAVQGMGAVGWGLCELLHKDGAELIVTDIRENVLAEAKEKFPGLKVVATDEIFGVEADIFAPCALGAQINDDTIPQLKCRAVVGAANNQLAEPRHEDALRERDILYVPDYVVNAGGVISIAYEYFRRVGTNPFEHDITYENMMAHVEKIGVTVEKILDMADSRGTTPARAADELAEAIFKARKAPKAANQR